MADGTEAGPQAGVSFFVRHVGHSWGCYRLMVPQRRDACASGQKFSLRRRRGASTEKTDDRKMGAKRGKGERPKS